MTTPPSPLPPSLPVGTTSLQGQWVLLGGPARLVQSAAGKWVYLGQWQSMRGGGVETMPVAAERIDWLPEEDPAAPNRRVDTMEESLESLRVAITNLQGWPLSKRDTFAAFSLMGLTSRLQPLQVNSTEHQELVVDLAFRLGDMAAAVSEKK